MAETKFEANYTNRSEAKRTREVISNAEWNEIWNLNSTQGDHSELWLDRIYKYLFGTSDFDTTTTAKIAAIDALIALKEDIATANALCATIEYNQSTGVFTFKDRSGNVMKTVDLNIEKIPVSVAVVWDSSTSKWMLRITNTDGTYTQCDVSSLFNPITFATDADHAVSFDVTTDSTGAKTVKATVKAGSITDAMLNSNLVAQLIGYVTAAAGSASAAATSATNAATSESNAADSASAASTSESNASTSEQNAGTSETNAGNSALKSEGYSVGKQNGVEVTEGSPYYHNNAKYYKELAEEHALADMEKSIYDPDLHETDIFEYADARIYQAKVHYSVTRWLRFNPNNHKGLIIKANTYIKNSQGVYIGFTTDTTIDLTDDITTNGADYFVYMADNGTIHAYTTEQSSGVKIGRFHTLCVNAGTMTMILPPSGSSVGNYVMVKSYREDEDADFYAFYRKSVTAVTSNNDTVAHPLSGYVAGDILPESIFCLSWHPNALVDDAMVYDKDTDKCIDIYLQSGIGLNTRSKYNQTHTVSRQQGNHMSDMRMVGKQLLSDAEFESASIGSNQATNIVGSSDKTTVGGHSDTAGRRMISAIGCEEMCGYLLQWTRDVASTGGSGWTTTDGNGSFGQEYGTPYVLLAGGTWNNGSVCGSRSRNSYYVRSSVSVAIGGRGSSCIIKDIKN